MTTAARMVSGVFDREPTAAPIPTTTATYTAVKKAASNP